MAKTTMTDKLHHSVVPGWQKRLGEIMESPWVTFVVILLILADLFCTIVNYILENTNWLNPVYHETGEELAELTHNICVTVLVIFLAEQLCHIVLFGRRFFHHRWYVLDLIVV
mmetsp:Transcript_97346/g.186665  ORF Transcript_97346/g.186665 Transcript_97346/m.186665 type:complete len:113 (+) Transcript_97346:101-439(+)